jgi:hypothetical protein
VNGSPPPLPPVALPVVPPPAPPLPPVVPPVVLPAFPPVAVPSAPPATLPPVLPPLACGVPPCGVAPPVAVSPWRRCRPWQGGARRPSRSRRCRPSRSRRCRPSRSLRCRPSRSCRRLRCFLPRPWRSLPSRCRWWLFHRSSGFRRTRPRHPVGLWTRTLPSERSGRARVGGREGEAQVPRSCGPNVEPGEPQVFALCGYRRSCEFHGANAPCIWSRSGVSKNARGVQPKVWRKNRWHWE